MSKTINWGILSTAKIGITKVIPAMQKSAYSNVVAIASRDIQKAEAIAGDLGIPTAHSSYEDLLNDSEIDAIYIPLPNHLHVEWAIRAMEAGKHVLLEKPAGLTAAEVEELIRHAANYPHLKIMEAFMYRFHPQWQLAKKLTDEGRIGKAGAIQAFFSYFNMDPANIRNMPEAGGGALMDIGCYCISQSRYIFGEEPIGISGKILRDPAMGADRLTSAVLEFPSGTTVFTCSTQLEPYQRFNILGTAGRIEIEIPVNTLPDGQSRICIYSNGRSEEVLFDPIDQYTAQADAFCRSILDDTPVPVPLIDALNNMKAIDLIKAAGKANS